MSDENSTTINTSDLTVDGPVETKPDWQQAFDALNSKLDAVAGRLDATKSDVIRVRKKVKADHDESPQPQRSEAASYIGLTRVMSKLPENVQNELISRLDNGAPVESVAELAEFFKNHYTAPDTMSASSETPKPSLPPGNAATAAQRQAMGHPQTTKEWNELRAKDPRRHRELLATMDFEDLKKLAYGS